MEPNEIQRALIAYVEAGPVSRSWAERTAGASEVKELLKHGYLDSDSGTLKIGRLYPFYKKYGYSRVIDMMLGLARIQRLFAMSHTTGRNAARRMPVEHEYLVNDLRAAGIVDVAAELQRMGLYR